MSASSKNRRASTSTIRVIGGRRVPLTDFHHRFLRLPWWAALSTLVAIYLLLNLGFAIVFAATGGVANARPYSVLDAFFFSIQTMGTIGYGSMYPTTVFANALVVLESVTGLVITAVATGLIFAKFSQSQARIVFTHQIVIAPMDGVPTLMFRVGNERGNRIIEAQLRVVMIRTERTAEGVTFYRMYDVPLSRDRSPAMSRSWTALHPIREGSPLHGATLESLARDEVEFLVTLFGVDDTSLQPVHAQKTYELENIRFRFRHADILTEDADGALTLDLNRFHELVPHQPGAA